jgi:hypothetical protein
MQTKIIDIETSMKLDRELEKKLKEEKRKLTRDIIKERVLKMMKEIYEQQEAEVYDKTAREDDMLNLNKNHDLGEFKYHSKNLLKHTRIFLLFIFNYFYFLVNTINTNEFDIPKNNRKKQRDFRKIKHQDTDTHKTTQVSIDKKLKISEKIKTKINLEFSDILGEFRMDIENFVDYVDRIIQNKKNIADFILEEDRFLAEAENFDKGSGDDRLYKACIDILIYNKENSLIPKRKMVRDRFEQEQEYYVANLIDTYLKKEDEQRSEIKDEIFKKKYENKEEQAEEVVIQYEQEEDPYGDSRQRKINYDDLIPWYIRLIEFGLIICYIIFNHFFINIVEISDINFFVSKIANIFQETNPCLSYLVDVQTPTGMNDWIYNCFMPT